MNVLILQTVGMSDIKYGSLSFLEFVSNFNFTPICGISLVSRLVTRKVL